MISEEAKSVLEHLESKITEALESMPISFEELQEKCVTAAQQVLVARDEGHQEFAKAYLVQAEAFGNAGHVMTNGIDNLKTIVLSMESIEKQLTTSGPF